MAIKPQIAPTCSFLRDISNPILTYESFPSVYSVVESKVDEPPK